MASSASTTSFSAHKTLNQSALGRLPTEVVAAAEGNLSREHGVRLSLAALFKNKRTDEILLHPDAIERLQAYFERTNPEPGQPVFPLRTPGGELRVTAKMMKHDCEAADLKYASSDGFVDFHANRVLFITSLCRSNVGLVTAQKLARHSDPKLTANTYAKVSTEERAEAINAISLRG